MRDPYIVDEEGVTPITVEQAEAFEAMRLRFTVILPIHNEAEMLPYTLRSIFDLGPDEVIFGLDRCTDASEDIIRGYAKHINYRGALKLRAFVDGDGVGWAFRPGYLRRELYRMSRNDVIVNTSADLRLDPIILDSLPDVSRCGLISFGYLDYPWNIQSFVKRVISETLPLHGFAGLLALSKAAWLASEDLEDLRTQPRILGEDTHLHHAIRRRYPTRHVNTRSLHLRANEDVVDHYKYGVVEWSLFRRAPLMAFAYAVVMLRPASWMGYVDARRIRP